MNEKKNNPADCTDFNVFIVPVYNQPVVQPDYVQKEEWCCKPVQVRGSLSKLEKD